MSTEPETQTSDALDSELAELLEVESFPAPPEFREQALLKDPAVYEQAARDPLGWWAREAEQLHWFRRWDTVLEDSNPPFYEWFVGGTEAGTVSRRDMRCPSLQR